MTTLAPAGPAGQALTLLPDPTPWEQALSEASAAQRPVDADLVRRVWDPYGCPAALLHVLAHAHGVKLWYADWPEGRQRAMIAAAIRLARLEGTEAGLEGYLAFTDAAVRRVVRPPATPFAVRTMTDAERERWIGRLPQIRLYPYLTRRTAPPARAFGSGPAGFATFAGADHGEASRGPSLYGRRATFQLPGGPEVEAHVDLLPVPGQAPAEQVRIGWGRSARDFLGHCFAGAAHLQATRAATRVVTVRLADGAAPSYSAATGLSLQDVRPVRVHAVRTAPAGRAFVGRCHLGSAHVVATAGPRLVFDRFALIDPSVVPAIRRGRSFAGRARFGIAPYTAEIRVEIAMRRPLAVAGVGTGQHLTGFLRRGRLRPLARALDAAGAARALRDTILVDPAIHRTVTLGDARPLGSFALGQTVRLT